MSSSVKASVVFPRPPSPTNQAGTTPPFTKEGFEAQKDARMHVSRWCDSATAFADPKNTQEVLEAARAHYSAYAGIVSSTLVRQITLGNKDLEVDAPNNRNDRAYLATLQLPAGYTLRIIEPEVQAAQKPPEAPVAAEDHSASLHPLSPARPYAPQGGLAKQPLQQLTQKQAQSLEPLVEAFYESVKHHADERLNISPAQRSLFVQRLLEDVENRAHSLGGDSESFQFELAAQLADKCRKFGDTKPLHALAPQLPGWGHMFEPDPESKDALQDYRPLMVSVSRGGKPAAQVKAPVERVGPPTVPTHIHTEVNAFVLNFDYVDAEASKEKVKKIVELIGKATDGSPKATMAMTAVVSDQLRETCARKKSSMPILRFFASNLPRDPQALFMDLWMSDALFTTTQNQVRTLEGDRVKMNKAQLKEFHKKVAGICTAIAQLPYQTNLMVTNELNREIERIAMVNGENGTAIRKLKLSEAPAIPQR
ncbi:MAG: hypothetical protein H7332_10345 [Bdellovibrionales bacterium]|nr:hypothetical protein [Ramlibacter sp.]